jgi:hypothetical protein
MKDSRTHEIEGSHFATASEQGRGVAPRKRVPTSIKLAPQVAEYLQWLSEALQRDRSFLINAIISEHAQKNRDRVPPPPLQIISM